jgi:hypothetical protein
MEDIDLGAIRIQILDRLRGQSCGARIRDVVVYLATNCWGWSADPIGELSNDDRREFIAAKFAVHRSIELSPA